jgi:hypothetical protein
MVLAGRERCVMFCFYLSHGRFALVKEITDLISVRAVGWSIASRRTARSWWSVGDLSEGIPMSRTVSIGTFRYIAGGQVTYFAWGCF